MRMIVRLQLLVGLVALLVLAPVSVAWAHAQLLAMEPAENSLLMASPEHLTLRFSEPVSPLALKLIGPDGGSHESTGTAAGNDVHVEVPGELAAGTHVLSWRVVSTDGHPIGGALVFSIGHVTGAAAATTADAAVAAALWAGKAVLFISLFVGVGGALFASAVALPATARTTALALSGLGLIVAPLTLGLQGLDALGLSLPSIVDDKAWAAAMSTSYGLTAIVIGIACLAAIGALALPRNKASAGLGLLAGTLAALSLALSGHASAAAPQWLARPAVFLHVAGVMFWVGALLPLWLLLRDRGASADRALQTFSRLIPYAVAPLVASGVTLAAIQLGWPGPHWLTPYAFILAAKLVLLVALFGLALLNRLRLTQPALAGEPLARRRLRRSVGLEMALVVLILGLVAGWRFTPPPRALALAPASTAAAEPLLVHLMDDKTMVMALLTPGSAGRVLLELAVTDIEGTPKPVQSLAVTIASPALGIEPIKRQATAVPAGWRVEDLTIPIAGTWQLDVEVRVSRFELSRLQTEISIP